MKISYNWLRQYLNIDKDPTELSDILTNIGLEVEGMEEWLSVEGGFKGIVIGEVVECKKHPNADTLSVTKVDIGSGDLLSIVCGAPNVAAGQKVPVATIGTPVKHGDNEFIIKKSKIRGELSEGMICAEDELGMGNKHEVIMVLSPDAKTGTPGSEYFNVEKDTVYEIGLTPNRIDGGSHYGVARDLAAFCNQKAPIVAIKPSVDSFKPDNNNNYIPVVIENSKDCPRYTGLTISSITVKESPEWLKNRIRSIGLEPINNIVDITNYVLHEIGQPLHAFDADMILGDRIIVKNLPDKTNFVTLDEQEKKLSSGDLMICNESEGMCIGGVFGGFTSGVTEKTKNIFLESAYFNPVAIRKTSRRHDLHTDASFRFERGVDPENTIWALKRAAILIKEIAGGDVSSEIVDVYPQKISPYRVKVSFSNIYRLIGKEIKEENIRKILVSLDIKILNESNGILNLEVPAYRVDVTREADVIEEILRIYGYNNIETTNQIRSTITYLDKPDKEKVINTISDMLSGYGFMEIMSNSLTPASLYNNSPDFDAETLVMLANPLSSDLNAMRQTLLFGGLSAAARNINRQNANLKFYEFGNCYFKNRPVAKAVEDFSEELSLDLFVTGTVRPENWNIKSEKTDFFFIKSAVEMVLEKTGINPADLSETSSVRNYFSDGAEYSINNKFLCEFGKLSRKTLNNLDIKQDIYYGHINWTRLMDLLKLQKTIYSELPKLPAVRRDLALLLDNRVKFSSIREAAFRCEKNILRRVGLFDVYEDKSLGQNKKSYAVSFILRDDKQTLTDRMIEKVMNNLIRVFKNEFNAEVR